jgi:gliding motility-associated-like protein
MKIKVVAFVVIAIILSTFSTQGQVHLNQGLLAYYPFNGNANDATGNDNNGIPMNGVQLTADRFGVPNSAYHFDGIDDYIIVNDNGKLSPKSVTVAAYVYAESTVGQEITGRIDRATGNAASYNLGIDYDVQTGFFFGVVPNSGSCFQQYPYDPSNPFAKSGSFTTNTWHCVVGTFSNSVLKVYVDGVLADTKSSPTPDLLACSNTQLLIGSWWIGDPIPFKGTIDDVRIYNRALNADEVSALCGLLGCPPLQGTLTGSNICSGNTQGYLTFHSPNTTGPFTLVYSDGTNTYTQTNVLDSVPFAVPSQPSGTTTYSLLSIEDTTNCPPTAITGEAATINVGSCSLCTGSLGDPVVNVTFGSGSNPGQPLPTAVPGASTTLQYVAVTGNPASPTPLDGQYSITNNVPFNADWFSGAADHTPGDPNGYMAFYNSSEQPGEFYSQTISNLCSATTYQFSAWIANALNPAATSGVNPDISFLIEQTDGTVLGVYDTGPVTQQSVFTWVQYGFFFTAPAGISTVILKMINNSPGGVANLGNDLAIDDITFRACGPVSTASFNATTTLDSIAACAGTDTVVYGTLSGGFASPGYLWQVSNDSGATWIDIPNSNHPQITIATPVTGSSKTYKYRLLNAESANINSTNCRVVSNLVSFTALAAPVPDFAFDQNICNPTQIQFSADSVSGGSYDWLINGVPFAGRNVASTFSLSGAFPVMLTLTLPGGCNKSVAKNISLPLQPSDIIATKDTTICSGTGLALRTLPSLQFCWSPTSYLDNATLANPTATPPATTKYYFTAKTVGANLIVNGDFSSGNTGFSSSYTYDPVNKTTGEYFVGPNPRAWNPIAPSNCGDHSSGSGNMLLIDGGPVTPISVWSQQITVTPNTNYAFSSWVQSLSTFNPAVLQFSINGVVLGNVINASSTACTWQQFFINWNSGNNTTALVSLVYENTTVIGVIGNDFAIDDISFAPIAVQIDSVTIAVETPSVAAFPDTTVCPGTPAPLHASGAASYSWSPGSTLSDSILSNPIAMPRATTSYVVTGISAAGCVAKDTIVVATFPHTTLIITPDTSVCQGSAVPLTASGGSGYSWAPAQFLDNPGIFNPVASPVISTRFFLNATDINSCIELDSVMVSILAKPVFQAPPGKSVCQGSSVIIGINSAGRNTYSWSPGSSLSDPLSATPLATPVLTTDYTLHVSDAVCANYDSTFIVTVEVNPNPTVIAQKSNDIDCSIGISQLNASGARSYSWTPAGGLSDPHLANPIASTDSTTTFTVEGTDINGCAGSDTVTVKVTDAGRNVFVVPNAFTPNGDGHNDCFGIQRWGAVVIEEFSIFDRWGMRVFNTKNPGDCWDGNCHGKQQPAGAYPYVIKARSFCGEITRTGVVVLVR